MAFFQQGFGGQFGAAQAAPSQPALGGFGASAPAFGMTAPTVPAFGGFRANSTAFGATQPMQAFGAPAFGFNSAGAAFGRKSIIFYLFAILQVLNISFHVPEPQQQQQGQPAFAGFGATSGFGGSISAFGASNAMFGATTGFGQSAPAFGAASAGGFGNAMFNMGQAQSSSAFGGFGAAQSGTAFGTPGFGSAAAPGAAAPFGAPAFGQAQQVPNTSVMAFQPSRGPDGTGAAAATATYLSITHLQPYQV